MTAPRATRRPPRRENETGAVTVSDVSETLCDLLSAIKDELAQVRTELAQLRGIIEGSVGADGSRFFIPGLSEEISTFPSTPRSAPPLVSPAHPNLSSSSGSKSTGSSMDPVDYARLIKRIRSLVRTVVPFNAVVAVVSRGDEALVNLEGRIAWHFPRLDDGRWVGHHPLDSNEAITDLERVRRQGARYLLFPATSQWWLSYYEEFTHHLESISTIVRHDDDCKIFALQPQEFK